ncbi:SUKH-4 family immunity protein [Streptomyces globisporus]
MTATLQVVTYPAGAPMPDEAVRALRDQGVPVAVAPYFRAATASDAVQLGAFAVQRKYPSLPGALSRWPRLGTDGGAELCVRPDGAVQAVFLADTVPDAGRRHTRVLRT